MLVFYSVMISRRVEKLKQKLKQDCDIRNNFVSGEGAKSHE
jgi:hypothetical protein